MTELASPAHEVIAFDEELAARYRAAGWYGDLTLADRVAELASGDRADRPAFIVGGRVWTWRQLDAVATRVAHTINSFGLRPRARVGVQMPDGGAVHAVMVGIERAGCVAVAIGVRAAQIERAHVFGRAGVESVVLGPSIRDVPADDVIAALRHDGVAVNRYVVVDQDGELTTAGEPVDERVEPAPSVKFSPDELYFINSTSGTTGLPKLVMHHQNRWMYFHQRAVEFGELRDDDIFCSLIPAPYGFGLWTSHFTPTLLGAPTIVQERFAADEALRAIAEHRATVLCCVSTQFLLMMQSPLFTELDLSSLRVMFTGGENVPAPSAMVWEQTTGCRVLQFFGSNETGLLSGTTMRDTDEKRLHTVGRAVPEMNVRLYDENGEPTDSEVGQPACLGPAMSLGYLDDPAANAELRTRDGWMLMADECRIDADRYLSIVGRRSDIIIRGGKNISAVAVENQVAFHPAVALAAAVGAPDPVFGERVCVFVELVDGTTLELEELRRFLLDRGVSPELVPERLVVVDELPVSSGGKIAKGTLRQRLGRPGDNETTHQTPEGDTK